MIDAKKFPGRSVEEPSDGKVLRGSHDGFTETLVQNTALASSMKSKSEVGNSITDGELSTKRTISPSITQAVAVSGRSVYCW